MRMGMGRISCNSWTTTAQQNDFNHITWIANNMLDLYQCKCLHSDAANCMRCSIYLYNKCDVIFSFNRHMIILSTCYKTGFLLIRTQDTTTRIGIKPFEIYKGKQIIWLFLFTILNLLIISHCQLNNMLIHDTKQYQEKQ